MTTESKLPMPAARFYPADELTVLQESQTRLPGFDLLVANDDIRRPTEWTIKEPRHTVIVHLGGRMDWLETEQEGHGGSRGPALPGECWMIPAGRNYTSRAHGQAIDYAVLTLNSLSPGRFGGQILRPFDLAPGSARRDAWLHTSLLQLICVNRERSDVARMFCESLSELMWLHLYRNYGDGAPAVAAPEASNVYPSAHVRILRDFIHENLGEDLRIEQLAGLVGQTTHQMLVSFRVTFGRTPWQYIIHERLRWAQRLLMDSTKDITTIAFETGFSSHSHLTRAFRKYLRCSPSEIRTTNPKRLFPVRHSSPQTELDCGDS